MTDRKQLARSNYDVAVFDAYAGLRRIGYTREGAIGALIVLGVAPEHVLDAATNYPEEKPE